MSAASELIRELNDAFRLAGPSGSGWIITQGVASLGTIAVLAAIAQVQRFDSFTSDNDPYGEHDFGSFEHAGEKLYWKIDYYDLNLEFGSPDPTDPSVTQRVLTILLASEY